MMTFRKIAAGSAGQLIRAYMTEQAIPEAERGLAGYYNGRDSRAAWKADMAPEVARALGIDVAKAPDDAALDRLFEAKRADDGGAWSRHTRKISSYDLTFSAHKSVSLAMAFAPTNAERAALIRAHEGAVDDAMGYVAREIGWARRGKAGCLGAEPGEVGWVRFLHFTSRPTVLVQDGPDGTTVPTDVAVPSDPQLHTHGALFNAVVTASGRVGSLDTKRIQGRVHEFGAYYQARLADRLRGLGVEVAYDSREQAVAISGISQDVCDAFSHRHHEVVRRVKEIARDLGLDWDTLAAERKSGLMQSAAVKGRRAKNDGMTDRDTWQATAAGLGWEHGSVLGRTVAPDLSPGERLEVAYGHAARRVAEAFQTKAVLDMDAIRTHAARGLIGSGLDGPQDIDRVVEALVERGVMLHGERTRLVIRLQDGKVRVTNTVQVAIEQGMAAAARAAAANTSGALLPAEIEHAIAAVGLDMKREPEHAAAQRAAIHALGGGGRLGVVLGVAGAGKSTMMRPLVRAWQAQGREVIGLGLAWRQADALQDAGVRTTFAVSPFLEAVRKGEVRVGRGTVLAVDEVGQIGPRQFLALLELQRATGCTIAALGDPEQCQAVEAGDTMEILRRVLPRSAMPELLSTIRQDTRHARQVAGLFRKGEAARALKMKRADGTAMLVGGDEEQVVGRIADHYLARRDALRAAGAQRGVTVSAPTNADAAAISGAIRERLRARGELGSDEVVLLATDNRRELYDLPIATGDRLRLFRKTWGTTEGRRAHLGSNGQVVEVLGQDAQGLQLRPVAGRPSKVVHVPWERLLDKESGRLLLGSGHCLTIDSAQGITSGEHVNAMPRGSAGVTAFKAYVAESRHVSQVWTMVGEAAEREAVRAARPLGDPRAITADDLWARVGERMSEKPYKPLGMDLLEQVRRNQQRSAAGFTAGCERLQRQAAGRDLAAAVQARRRDEAVVATVATHLGPLASAVEVQHNNLDVLMKGAVVQLDRLDRVLDGQIRRAREAIVARWHPPKPAASEVAWKSSPSPGF
ncbi:MAG: MobF family relaxase [Janthinobacterium lividum]